MDDLISRQWLMECVEEGWIKFDTEKDKNKFIHLVRDMAPSVQPERKKGKWQWLSSTYDRTPCEMRYMCSECHHETILHTNETSRPWEKFCPNCGAMMEVEHGYQS